MLLLLQWCKNYSTGILHKARLEVFLHINEFYPILDLPGPQLLFWLKDSTNYVHSTLKFSSCLRNRSTKSLKYKMLPSSHLSKKQLFISFQNWGRFFCWCLVFWGFLTIQSQRTSKPCTLSLPRPLFQLFNLLIPFGLKKKIAHSTSIVLQKIILKLSIFPLISRESGPAWQRQSCSSVQYVTFHGSVTPGSVQHGAAAISGLSILPGGLRTVVGFT